MFILWFCLITLPFLILGSYSPPKRFTFDTIFNTRGYLENSLLFYGVYPNQSLPIRNESNNQHYHVNYPIPLIYLLCGYFYFIFWFIFIGIRFSYVYKNNVLDSILRSKRGNGFLSTFARWDYTIHEDEHKKEQIQICYNQLREIINHENNKRLNRKKKHDYYKSYYYIFKIVIINLLYVGLAVGLGIANYFLLSSKSSAMTSEHYQTLIFMSFINRFGPYLLTILAQFEKYKYPSYRLYTIGCRNLFLNASLIVSLIVYFYQQRSELEKLNNCWENGFGQIFYILSLIDIFFSIVSVLFFGSLMDLIVQLFLTDSIVKKSTTANSSMDKKNKKVLYKYSRMFDGINIHVQITPTQLLYSQLLIWIGTYFSPLLVLLQLLNILFSFWTYRFYIFLRDISCNQRRKIATIKRVYIWNAYRLNNMFYLLSFFCLTLAITCFVIFSTQLETSSNCGPFAHYNRTYEVIEELIPKQKSVVVVSIINFLSSPGLTYFGLIIFIIVAYKFKHEASAEKELVFIRESNLESKKLYRQKLVERLHNQTTQQRQPLEIVLTHKIEKSTL
ncbi:unnamed protein product [Didymodactylos carnosus]|nr:unnamed protein product [Didymodactylos carnosus]CAF3822756.1 unnamed protein product [Didymodactylos carnosus]